MGAVCYIQGASGSVCPAGTEMPFTAGISYGGHTTISSGKASVSINVAGYGTTYPRGCWYSGSNRYFNTNTGVQSGSTGGHMPLCRGFTNGWDAQCGQPCQKPTSTGKCDNPLSLEECMAYAATHCTGGARQNSGGGCPSGSSLVWYRSFSSTGYPSGCFEYGNAGVHYNTEPSGGSASGSAKPICQSGAAATVCA